MSYELKKITTLEEWDKFLETYPATRTHIRCIKEFIENKHGSAYVHYGVAELGGLQFDVRFNTSEVNKRVINGVDDMTIYVDREKIMGYIISLNEKDPECTIESHLNLISAFIFSTCLLRNIIDRDHQLDQVTLEDGTSVLNHVCRRSFLDNLAKELNYDYLYDKNADNYFSLTRGNFDILMHIAQLLVAMSQYDITQ